MTLMKVSVQTTFSPQKDFEYLDRTTLIKYTF